jgi:hypothetical protein
MRSDFAEGRDPEESHRVVELLGEHAEARDTPA